MDGVVVNVLASAGQPQDYAPGASHWWVIRTIVLVLFIPGTLFAILLLYGGKVQNKNIGPLALRGILGKTPTLHAPRTIVTSDLEAKRVRCTFYLQYLDRQGRPRLRQLCKTKRFVYKLSALNRRYSIEKSDMVAFWNPPNWSSLQDALTTNIPFEAADNNILMKDTLEDADVRKLLPKPLGEILSLPDEDFKALAQAHRDEIQSRLTKFGTFKKSWDTQAQKRKARGKEPRRRFSDAPAYKDLPDLAQDANLYMRMHFSANPLTHPDEQVKTTAWLTVLTSVFALLSTWLYQGF